MRIIMATDPAKLMAAMVTVAAAEREISQTVGINSTAAPYADRSCIRPYLPVTGMRAAINNPAEIDRQSAENTIGKSYRGASQPMVKIVMLINESVSKKAIIKNDERFR